MKRVVVALVPILVCLAVLVFTGRLRGSPPDVVAARRQATVAASPDAMVAASGDARGAQSAAHAFAEALWSYDWRRGSEATARAVAAWATPTLAARVANFSGAPVWDAERKAAHETDRPGRVLVTVEDRTPRAVGFAVSASVEVDRLGKAPSQVPRDAEILVRLVDRRWLVAAVQQ